VASSDSAAASNSAQKKQQKKSQTQKATHPRNRLRAANVLAAFLVAAAAGTEPSDDANRSIGQAYCFGTTGNGPYGAERIVACSHIVVASSSSMRR
jgi:hypothetical protein